MTLLLKKVYHCHSERISYISEESYNTKRNNKLNILYYKNIKK